jgi:hypothetical protein
MRHEGFEVQAIESESTGSGVPDSFFAGNGKQGWMELKNDKSLDDIIGLVNEDSIKIAFRPGQYSWLNRFKNKGVDVYLVLNCALGLFFFKNDEIQEEYSILDLIQHEKLDKMKNIGTMI